MGGLFSSNLHNVVHNFHEQMVMLPATKVAPYMVYFTEQNFKQLIHAHTFVAGHVADSSDWSQILFEVE